MIAPAAALLGVALGPALTARVEHRRWLRDERLKSVVGVLNAARAILWRGDDINSPNQAELKMQKENVRQAMFVLREHLAAVDILMAGQLGRQADSLEDAFGNRLYEYFMSVTATVDPSHSTILEARQCTTAFREAAKFLTLPPRLRDIWLGE